MGNADPSIFSRIIEGELPCFKIFEDDLCFAFLDIFPINPGHTLVVTKTQIEEIWDCDEDLYSHLMKTAKSLVPALKAASGAPKIGIIVEGFLIPHVHVHLVPIFSGGELNPNRAVKANDEDLTVMANKILTHL